MSSRDEIPSRDAFSQSAVEESLRRRIVARSGGRSDAAYATTLLDAARDAECTDWTLLLATVLGRADVLCETFEAQPELREPWMRVSKECAKRSSDGDLVAQLTSIVADIERIASVAA